MARKKTQPEPETHAVAEDFAKDEPLHQPKEEAPAKTKTIDMVRAAIAAGHATAKVGLPWILKTYGVEMKPGNFSVTKSTIERGGRKAASLQKQSRAPRHPKAEAPAATQAPAQTNGHMSPSEAAKAVKQLVDTLGAAEVKNLVELFGG